MKIVIIFKPHGAGENGGVCVMFGTCCSAFILNNAAPDGSITKALHRLTTELAESWDILDSWFGRWKGTTDTIWTSVSVVAGPLVLFWLCLRYNSAFHRNCSNKKKIGFVPPLIQSVSKSHPKYSHVWFPNRTLTVLPAPRFSPMMVTFVPPDSGPRLGDSPVIVGVYQTDKRRCESEFMGQKTWSKQKTRRLIFSENSLKPSCIITYPWKIIVVQVAIPLTVECRASGGKW